MFALLVPPGPTLHDAVSYLAMVRGPVTAVNSPFCYRVGAPLLARVWPGSPQAGLAAVTFVSMALAVMLWFRMGRGLGLSRRALGMAGLAIASTQAWMGLFNNPYLTDGAGLLGLTAGWAAWVADAFWWVLPVLALGPLFRETVAPVALLWARDRRWGRFALALLLVVAPLAAVRMAPGMPSSASSEGALLHALRMKGVFANLGDALASYHALWWLAGVGLRRAPAERLRVLVPPLVLFLAVAGVLSLLGNTVRMFALAMPFMALAVAECFEALAQRDARAAWALAAVLSLGVFVWYPTRPLGAGVSAHPVFQYLFAAVALLASALALRRAYGRDLAPRPLTR